jgi:hypothetical protein
MLKQEVLSSIPDYLAIYEGHFQYIYNDSVNIATTGIGNRVEPYEQYGYKFKFFKYAGNQQASAAEVMAEIRACKNKATYKPSLYTTEAQIIERTLRAFKDNWDMARTYFGPDFDRFPADVQVVLSQMGYGGGLVKRKVNLEPFLKKRDFYGAMTYTTLGPDHQRYNKGFRILMTNGWIVEESIKKGGAMKYWAPNDLSRFWGTRRFLQISRWYTDDIIYEMRTTDSIIEADCSNWLRKQPNRL